MIHSWIETDYPACLNPNTPFRYCEECQKEEFDDGTVIPGWVTTAPCYEREVMLKMNRGRVYKCQDCPDPHCRLWIYEYGHTVASAPTWELAMKSLGERFRVHKLERWLGW